MSFTFEALKRYLQAQGLVIPILWVSLVVCLFNALITYVMMYIFGLGFLVCDFPFYWTNQVLECFSSYSQIILFHFEGSANFTQHHLYGNDVFWYSLYLLADWLAQGTDWWFFKKTNFVRRELPSRSDSFWFEWCGLSKTWGGWSRDSLRGWTEFFALGVPGVLMVCAEW